MNDMTTTNLLSIADVMAKTTLSRGSVYTLIRSGELRGVKVGARTVVRSTDFEAWLDTLNDVQS